MPTSAALTLATIRADIRADLYDTDPTAYRWTDALLAREIDRAVERYSFVSAQLITSQIPTIPFSRLYPVPAGAWWVERVELPLGTWPKTYPIFLERTSPQLTPPSWTGSSPFTVAVSPGGPLSGAYQYAATFTVPGGETTPSIALPITVGAGSQVTLSGIPTGPYGATGRNLYRTVAGGATLQLLAQIADNTTTLLVDSTPDGSLGATAPTVNSSGNIPQIELQLDNARLPVDASGLLELTCAFKHELDPFGTTIPEKHWDAIALGAEAFALLSYVTSTNDNFDYVDGQFRDRVDDTKAPLAWMAQATDTMRRFNSRLEEIRDEATTLIPPIPQWGDKPRWWDRL